MNVEELFGRADKIFLPVIHAEDETQVARNIKIAVNVGADGVWLINHGIGYTQLLSIYDWVWGDFPNLWIGLNCLDLGFAAIEKIPKDIKGLWVDDPVVTEQGQTVAHHHFETFRDGSGWKGLFFGSVAFKTHGPVKNPDRLATLAREHTDVIVTSGDRTGQPPTTEKIRSVRHAIGGHPLAIASGMTPENVLNYAPYANIFMSATGISESFTRLDPKKSRDFARRLGK